MAARKSKAEKAQEAINSGTPTQSTTKASLTDTSINLEKEFAGDNTYLYTETHTYSPEIGTGTLEVLDTGISSTSSVNSTNLAALNMTSLPLTYDPKLPDFSAVFAVTDYGNPDSFAAAGIKRVTNAKREQDKIAYQEHDNYLQNVTDGLKVATTAMGAAIQAAKLGQQSIKYAIAREGMETERWNYRAAQTKTELAEESYNGERIKLQYAKGQNVVNGAVYSTKLASLRLTLQEERHALQSKQAEVAALIGGATY